MTHVAPARAHGYGERWTRYALRLLHSAAPDPSRCTRSVALHPIRRATPDQKGCNAYGSGAPPPATSPNASISSRHTQAAASDAATQPRNTRPAPNKRRYTRSVAIHPIRRTAPNQKGCNAYGSGAPPPTTSTTADSCSPFTHSRSVSRRPCTRHCTRYVALHPIRRGVMPTDRVHHLIFNKRDHG